MIAFIDRLHQKKDRIAVVDESGEHSYQDLLLSSEKAGSSFLEGKSSLNEGRVAFLVPSRFEYVPVMLGIWRAGGIAVPLCVSHPDPEIDYVIKDSGAEAVIAHTDFEERLKKLAASNGARFYSLEEVLNSTTCKLPDVDENQRAMIVYTSGSTGKPKGVVTTHRNIESQITTLVQAWGWTEDDYILNVLPLHHVHGIVNVLLCALWSGAKCEMTPKFDADAVWGEFIQNDYSLFMAVPTIYSRLIGTWDGATPGVRQKMSNACKKMRLMVSGSAALPVGTLQKWKEISGHVLLERYGMTEIGMALSNPLHGERVPGHVGKPLPGVDIRLFETDQSSGKAAGEILVKGHNVFLEYWRRPQETKDAFTDDGWFKTGDIVSVNEDGVYKILGRDSVDIIKSGGYKISALEIEEALRQHPDILECSVVGVEDIEWGERVCAAIITAEKSDLNPDMLRVWCKQRLAPYKIPANILQVSVLPRNVMGKVVKPEIMKLFRPEN